MNNQFDELTFKNIMNLLIPHSARGCEKIRVGRDYDGGYILLNDLHRASVAICGGLNDDDSFERDLLNKGIKVLAFDHTESYTFQDQDRGYQWFKVPLSKFESPNSILDLALSGYNDYSAILKIDIEGDEWEMLEKTNDQTYKKIRQFVCEFHNFPMNNRAFETFQKICKNFKVVHVHGNNWAGAFSYGNQVIPIVIEITFANIDCYDLSIQGDHYPTSYDQPNHIDRSDYILGTFTI